MARGGETMGERMVAVEQWQDDHEERCAERQVSIGREIKGLKTDVGKLTNGAWGMVIALLAWALVQLYAKLDHPAPAPPAAAAATR